MNVIVIITDTMRRDHLGCYGNPWIRTPNIDRLASESVVFERAYTGSFPTVPNRTDVMTGRFAFTYHTWAPLLPDEVLLSRTLSKADYLTMMVVDTPHIMLNGFNFDRGFHAFEWIRGQENDRWRVFPANPELPCSLSKVRNPEACFRNHLRNTASRKGDEDHFVARTMRTAADWITEYDSEKPFFLYVDTFDPHEPWDPPKRYTEMYNPGYTGEEVLYPRYGPTDFLTPEELKHCRALYAGEVSFVDTWVGYLLDRIDSLGLRENTMVIYTTDHGFYHGEYGLIGKMIGTEYGNVPIPLFNEMIHIPLMVRFPGVKPRRAEAIVQPADLMPTILDCCGAGIPPTVHGRSFMPVLKGETDSHRDMAVSSQSLIRGVKVRNWTTITKGDWQLHYNGVRYEPEPGMDKPEMNIENYGFAGPMLYNTAEDPKSENNQIHEHPDLARQLHAEHVEFLKQISTPEKNLLNRKELVIPEQDG